MPSYCRLLALTGASRFYTFCRDKLPASIFNVLDVCGLFAIDLLRLTCGHSRAKGVEKCKRPTKPLELYEFEACPFCRKVRETLTCLDIDHVVYPCPRETLKKAGFCENARYRPDLPAKFGVEKLEFPFLYDDNTKEKIQGSQKIVDYLWNTYGSEAQRPLKYRLAHWNPYFMCSSKVCSYFRPQFEMGFLRIPSKKPQTRLELYGFESSPFVRRVREILSCLELEYLYVEVPRGSVEKRADFAKKYSEEFSQKWLRNKAGLIQVPYLADPNTNKRLFESADIVKYLETTYKTGELPDETWMDYGSEDKKVEEKKKSD